MQEFLKKILDSLKSGAGVELVSVVEASGSTPRGAGAMLAVFSDGISGTVGGGNVEYEATKLARELLVSGENTLRRFRFVQGDVASLGMVCGGDVTLHFQYLDPENAEQISVLEALLKATGENADTWLVRKLDGAQVTFMGLARRRSVHGDAPEIPPDLLQSETVYRDGWFVLPAVKAGRVYIFGGGHVSQALVPAIAAVGFRAVVLDDRPEFSDLKLFPQAEKAICCDFQDLSGVLQLTPDDYVVIMTRGHQADYEVLTQTLRSGVRYLGCIGSKRKLALCRDRLLEDGYTAEEYQKVHAPIGLAIGAETPAEIAVSITAELIATRAGLNLYR